MNDYTWFALLCHQRLLNLAKDYCFVDLGEICRIDLNDRSLDVKQLGFPFE